MTSRTPAALEAERRLARLVFDGAGSDVADAAEGEVRPPLG